MQTPTTATTPAAPIFTEERIRESHRQDVLTREWVLRNGTLRARCVKAQGIGRCEAPVSLDGGDFCTAHDRRTWSVLAPSGQAVASRLPSRKAAEAIRAELVQDERFRTPATEAYGYTVEQD